MRRLACGVLGVLMLGGAARGYEADSTLAGLVEQAALSSRLHRVLAERFGRSQGLFDPLRLSLGRLPAAQARSLRSRLLRLDPVEGYAPEDLSKGTYGLRAPERQAALGWLMAGAVIESLPASRARNHFTNGQSGAGLTLVGDEQRGAVAVSAVRLGLASSRELLTGVAFDGTGRSAREWVGTAGAADDNDLSLAAFQRAYVDAVTGKDEGARETALAQALLAAGAVLGVLGQQGDPAYVRNDPDPLLGAAAYQAFVAKRFGRAGVPAPLPAQAAPWLSGVKRLDGLFYSGDGRGLSERTARNFYSAGSLPGSERGAAAPLRGLPMPRAGEKLPGVFARASAGYFGDAAVPHRVAWRRVPVTRGEAPRVTWFLDERCHADYAAALLPEIGRYQVAALELLFGGDAQLSRDRQGALHLRLDVPLRGGKVTVLGEDRQGQRRVMYSGALGAGAEHVLPVVLTEAGTPALQRLAVLVDGTDGEGQRALTSAELGL